MEIEKIKELETAEQIKELKKGRKIKLDANELLKDWDFTKHDVMEENKRPKRKVQVKKAVENNDGTIKIPAKYELKEVNRVALPLEQDIVNIHTAFTVGYEPNLLVNSEDEQEKNFFKMIKNILKSNKTKYSNKRLVRAWLSECEVAEYWFAVDNPKWWQKITEDKGTLPKTQLKSVIWSPFRGDKLFPYYDKYGNLTAFSREYKIKDDKGQEITKFMTIDDKNVTIYVDQKVESSVTHGFNKIPVLYMYREKPYCHKIRTIRDRLEFLLSNFADCLDYNFFPKLTASGAVQDIKNRGTGSEIIQLENGATVAYLTWKQSPDMAKLEFDNLTERAYALTNTPRISFENLKGTAQAPSGVAFEYVFMSTHMAVSNHAEVVEEFLQRRINFLIAAVGAIYKKTTKIAENITIDTEIVPYTLNNKSNNISDAVEAVSGGIASLESGIVMAGITDRVKEEVDKIKAEKQADTFEPTK